MDMQQNSSMSGREPIISSHSDGSSDGNHCGSCQCCGVTSGYKRIFDNETETKFEHGDAKHFQNFDYDDDYSRKTDITSHPQIADDNNERRNETKTTKHQSHTLNEIQNIQNKTMKRPLISKKPRQRYQSEKETVHKTHSSIQLKRTLSDGDKRNSVEDCKRSSYKHKILSTNYNRCDVSHEDALTPMLANSPLDRRQSKDDQDITESQNTPDDQQSLEYLKQSDSDRRSNRENIIRTKSFKQLDLTSDAITGGENSFFQLYDKRVHDFQQERKDNEELRKMYYRIKKYFIILSFCNVIVIISVLTMVPMTFLSVTLNGYKDAKVKPEWSETLTQQKHLDEINNKGELDIQTQTLVSSIVNQALFCLECWQMSTLDVNRKMDKHGKCCFRDMWDVIQSIVKTTDKYGQKLEKEINEDMGRYQQPTDRNSHKTSRLEDSSSIPNAAVTLNKIESLLETVITKKRAAIHLKNKGFSNTSSQPNFGWYYDDMQGDLQMSSDNTSIRIESGGYYFMYSKIMFIRNSLVPPLSNVRLSFQMVKKSNIGLTTIGEATQRCMFNDSVVEHESSIQVVTYLEQGSSVSLRFPPSQRLYISTAANVHVLGMFEL